MNINDCNKCKICESTKIKCSPRGTDSPVLYFVGEAMGPEECKEGIPFVGRAGKYLFNILDEFGLNDNNCRFWNTILCYPKSEDENKSFRAPKQEEIDNCIGNVIGDIIDKKPRVVIPLGATATRAFIGEEFTAMSKVRGNKFMMRLEDCDEEILVLPTFHPSYLMRNPNDERIHSDFKKDIKLAMNLSVDRNYREQDNDDIPEGQEYRDCSSKTIEIRTYKEFDSFCKEHIDSYDLVGYDIETNAEEVHCSSHRVVGFSLATTIDLGCYVILDSLDYTMSDLDRRLVEKRLRKILSSKKVMVYNSQHELPATLNWLGIDLATNIEDLFIKVKIMNSDAVTYQ